MNRTPVTTKVAIVRPSFHLQFAPANVKTKKAHRQVADDVAKAPPTTGPRTAPVPHTTPIPDMYRPRSFSVVQRVR
ncbi:MAG: hypothetical protein Q9164_000392 [Protoblastenia rupestris]